MEFALALLPNGEKVSSHEFCFQKIPGGYKPIGPHKYKYSYVRGREDVFEQYRFPVWIAARYCMRCRFRQVLCPSFQNFNSTFAGWIEEEIMTR
jgi:hypothetical protein